MTRSRAALLAAVVALLLGAAYLLSRRTTSPVELADVTPARPDLPAVPPSPGETASAVAPAAAIDPDTPTAAIAAEPVASLGKTTEPPRSWGAGRAVPARTPAPIADPVAGLREDTEEPLPAWVRAAIVVAALVAFFAVSLIATKQV